MKFKAAFMMFLILSLPFYVSSALAVVAPDRPPGLVKEVRVYGSLMNQTKALRPDANVYVEVIIAETNVSPTQVKFTGGQNFQSCFPHPQGSMCTLVISPPTAMTQGVKTYSLTYYPKSGTPYSLTGSYVVDGTPPVVTSFGTGTGVTSAVNGKILVSYSANDIAADANYCAGIAGFMIAEDAQFTKIVDNVKIDVTSLDDCFKSGQLEVNAPITDGVYTWYARAYDRLGNVAYSVKQTTFIVDNEAPAVTNVRLFKAGHNTTIVGAGTGMYVVKAEIREPNVLESAYLDIASPLKAVCQQVDDELYSCTWSAQLNIASTATSVRGVITVEDNQGNSDDHTFNIPITVDKGAPSIGYFGSQYGPYLGQGGNTLFIRAQDPDGAALRKENVYADLHLLNPNIGVQRYADECIGERCYWYNIVTTKLHGATATARVFVGDDFGHVNILDTLFTVDKQPPVINEVVRSIEFPTAEDEQYFFFALNASDDIGVANVTANISAISNYGKIVIGDCDEYDDSTVCFFITPQLKTSYAVGDVIFTVSDFAGNKVEYAYDMILYEADADTVPEEVEEIRVESVSPEKLDRKIATQIPVKVFIGVDYVYEHDNVEVVDARLDCANLTGLGLLHQSTSQNPYWIGEEYVVFEIQLNDATSRLDKIKFNCTVDMKIRRGGIVFINPEREPLNAEIELYELPLGTIDDATVEKVEDILEGIEGWGKWAEEIDKWLTVATRICDAFGIFQKAYDIIQSFKPILYGILSAVHAYPPAKPIADGIWRWYSIGTCYIKVAKDFAWPNTNPSSLGAYGKEQVTTPESSFFYPWEGRGIVRNICALVKCRQCNTDWGFISEWVNLPGTLVNKIPACGEGGVFGKVDLSVRVDPFDSWPVAASCLCIPGLIHNARKYKQLECMHANCIVENAKAGFSTAPCDELDRERKCIFWYGPLFHLIPGYLFSKMIVDKIKQVLTNLPGRLVTASRDWMCGSFDKAVSEEAYLSSIDQNEKCQTSKDVPQSIPDPTNKKFIFCSVIDAAMLVYSWNDFVDNTFNADEWKKYFDFKQEPDICKDVDWEAVGLEYED
ncbi:hypothetical protein KY316_00960 [Candidatus Woesearchaeota archaeon]|nr:hypothetical protein [Candidatus Woesearchaeota archaeon]